MSEGVTFRPPHHARSISSRRYPRLEAEIVARGWSLADLARASGVPYLRLVRTTAGQNAPSMDTMERTARVLSLPPHELWRRESELSDFGASVPV